MSECGFELHGRDDGDEGGGGGGGDGNGDM